MRLCEALRVYGRPCPKVNLQSSSFSKRSADPLKGGTIRGLSIRQGIGTWSMRMEGVEGGASTPPSLVSPLAPQSRRVTEREGWLLAVAALFLNSTAVSILIFSAR